MSNYGTTTPMTTYVTQGDSRTSPWDKVRRALCSSADPSEGDDREQESLLQHSIRRGGKFMCLDVEWEEEKPKQRRYKAGKSA